MNGKLPQTVEKTIEKQYLEWEGVDGDLNIDGTDNDNIKIISKFLGSL